MARTPSTMRDLGFSAPSFSLPDVRDGKLVSFDTLPATRGLLIAFICNHCPFVKHIMGPLIALGNEMVQQGFSVVFVSSNDAEAYPDDSPAAMRELAQRENFAFPYVYDESQSVAKAYDAACTPDFFLFDSGLRCVYRGQFDGSRPGTAVPVTGADLRAAMNAVLAGKLPSSEQSPSLGCNIKWK